MSRVGKRVLIVPENVQVLIEGLKITIKGPKGELSKTFSPLVNIKVDQNKLMIKRKNEEKQTIMLHGTTNSLIQGMLLGVVKEFTKELEINGVGYNVVLNNNKLIFSLGLSHKIELQIPKSLKVEVPKPTQIIIYGIDKQEVGQFAAKIRLFRKPEPYGGKGIKYKDEIIIRKSGKASSK